MRPDHRRTALSIVLLCTIPLAACGASDSPGEDPSIMRWGGDLLGGGSNVSVSDSVAGDVIIAGRQLGFSGIAGGDYLGAGGVQAIGGRVVGDVRAAGREVLLSGRVGENVTAAGEQVAVGEGAAIEGNAYLAGRRVRVDGRIDGSLRAAGQAIVLDGPIDGSVDVRGGSLRVGPEARITGDLVYKVPAEETVIDPAAQIGGTMTARPTPQGPPVGLLRALLMVGFLVAGAVVVALLAGTAGAAEAALRARPAAALGWGVAWVVLVPLGVGMIAMTLIGLPLAAILLVLYLISVYLGRAVIALWLGRMLVRGGSWQGRGRLVGAFLVGGVILLLVCLIPILGGLVMVLATLFGLGALAVAHRRRRERA